MNTFRSLLQPSLPTWSRTRTPTRVLTILLSTLIAVQALGQSIGTLRGRISDSRGHAVAGAQVLLYVGTRTDPKSTAVSDQSGNFEFTDLAPASDYRLQVSHSGYVHIEATGITLRAGQNKQLQITLDPHRALSTAVTEVSAAGVEQQVRTLP